METFRGWLGFFMETIISNKELLFLTVYTFVKIKKWYISYFILDMRGHKNVQHSRNDRMATT